MMILRHEFSSPYRAVRSVLNLTLLVWLPLALIAGVLTELDRRNESGIPSSVVRQLADHEARLKQSEAEQIRLAGMYISDRLTKVEQAVIRNREVEAEHNAQNVRLLYLILSCLMALVCKILLDVTRWLLTSGGNLVQLKLPSK